MLHNTVHIIDDDAALRDSLCMLFQASNFLPLEYRDGKSFLEHLPSLDQGCVLIDVNMPGISGIEVLAAIKAAGSTLPCIIMTGFGEVSLAVRAMKAGAVDFIEKPFESDILIEAVQNALNQLKTTNADNSSDHRLSRLTPRELDVMAGIARGHQNKVIAHQLGISPRTVEIHRARVMTKLEAPSVADIVKIALQSGLSVI